MAEAPADGQDVHTYLDTLSPKKRVKFLRAMGDMLHTNVVPLKDDPKKAETIAQAKAIFREELPRCSARAEPIDCRRGRLGPLLRGRPFSLGRRPSFAEPPLIITTRVLALNGEQRSVSPIDVDGGMMPGLQKSFLRQCPGRGLVGRGDESDCRNRVPSILNVEGKRLRHLIAPI